MRPAAPVGPTPVARHATTLVERSWRGRGPLAMVLWPLACLYGLAVGCRRGLYQLGWLQAARLPVPVVVVGNLVVGGAGKTPTVIATVATLRRQGWHPGIVSRGYGGSYAGALEVTDTTPAGQCGDEPLLLRWRTRAPVVVCRDRVVAVQRLLAAHPRVDVVVADDGLQHLALRREVQILVFDERGAGNGWLLPAGALREPMPARLPDRTLVVYNASVPSTALPGLCAQRRIAGVLSLEAWRSGGVEPSSVQLEALRGRPVLAAAGIGQPERFFAMLRATGLEIVPLALPDHHDFRTLPWSAATPEVVVTEKDAIKLDPAQLGATHVWVAPLDFVLETAFATALAQLLPERKQPGPG